MPDHSVLTVHQRLATSGARAVEVFRTGGALRLVIPQLAGDIPGGHAGAHERREQRRRHAVIRLARRKI